MSSQVCKNGPCPLPPVLPAPLCCFVILNDQMVGANTVIQVPEPLSPKLKALIRRCLSYDPSARPTALEVVAGLRKALNGLIEVSLPTSWKWRVIMQIETCAVHYIDISACYEARTCCILGLHNLKSWDYCHKKAMLVSALEWIWGQRYRVWYTNSISTCTQNLPQVVLFQKDIPNISRAAPAHSTC